MALDSVIPKLWTPDVHLLKVDVQGFEALVFDGAVASLRAGAFRYVLFELSPTLMQQRGTGEPLELLQRLPVLGAMCFDAMGGYWDRHQDAARGFARAPLEQYMDGLSGGHNCDPFMFASKAGKSHTCNGWNFTQRRTASVTGPWEDILCMFPHSL